jgi:anti-sigma regulatory factor (Ser/Thr protein kinase)
LQETGADRVSGTELGLTLVEIGTVARELGVATSTLRSWERRYRIVVPRRGPTGHRLYDTEQVQVLRQILAQVRSGMRAGAAHGAVPTAVPVTAARLLLLPAAGAMREARHAVDELVAERADGQTAFNLRLVASELVANAVLYGPRDEPIELEIQLYCDCAELKVSNGGSRLRIKSLRSRRRAGGHGLEIVDTLADAWTIEAGPRGTTVTVRLSLASGAGEH